MKALSASLLLLMLAGCGQKGPLYFAPPPQPQAAPAPQESNSDSQQQDSKKHDTQDSTNQP